MDQESRPHTLPERPVLEPDAVHVWWTTLDHACAAVGHLAALLSASETARAESYHRATDRSHFVVAHGLLRVLLSRYLREAPARISFRRGSFGKPFLQRAQTDADLRFNLSHAGGMAAFALTMGREVGVDIETLRPLSDIVDIAGSVLSGREHREWTGLPPDAQAGALLRSWTCKEALLKACGRGIAGFPMTGIEIAVSPGDQVRLLSFDGDENCAARWSLCPLALFPDHVGALAVEGKGVNIRCRHWPWYDEGVA